MSFKKGSNYLILSGGKINTDQNYALTCDPDVKEKAHMKFSTSLDDAINDPRCHFQFEENNYQDKTDNFKWYIKSAKNPDLFLCFGLDVKYDVLDLNLKVILNNGYSDGYKYSFNITNQDFCNYKLSGYYYDVQTKRNEVFRFSSYKDTNKGKEFVLSIDTDPRIVEKTKDNFLFRIIPLDVTFCYKEQRLTENLLQKGKQVIIVPGTKPTDYRALTCIKGITEESQIKAGTPYEYAFDDPNCVFTVEKNPYDEDYLALSMTNGEGKKFFLTTSGYSIEHSLFKMTLPVQLNSKGGLYGYEYLFKFKPEGCFYKMYGVFPEGSDNVMTEYRMSTYKNTAGLFSLSVGYNDDAAENKENFLFRIIPVSKDDSCDSLYTFKTLNDYTLKPCGNEFYRIMNDKFVLSDSFNFQFMENLNNEEEFCFNLVYVGENQFNILNKNGLKLCINMNEKREKFLQFIETEKMFITNDREKLQTFNFHDQTFILSTPTDCIKETFVLKNSKGMLKMEKLENLEKLDSLGEEYKFKITKKEEKLIEKFENKSCEETIKINHIDHFLLFLLFVSFFTFVCIIVLRTSKK